MNIPDEAMMKEQDMTDTPDKFFHRQNFGGYEMLSHPDGSYVSVYEVAKAGVLLAKLDGRETT